MWQRLALEGTLDARISRSPSKNENENDDEDEDDFRNERSRFETPAFVGLFPLTATSFALAPRSIVPKNRPRPRRRPRPRALSVAGSKRFALKRDRR